VSEPVAAGAVPVVAGADEAVAGGDAAGAPGEVLVALADPTRRHLLAELAARGTATGTELAEQLPVSRQAVVKHLAVLSRAGLVAGQREGREVRYIARPEGLAATARWMAELAAEWDQRLRDIKRIAESGD
jgi:DNA-binding transcriptional ArsR family regulator